MAVFAHRYRPARGRNVILVASPQFCNPDVPKCNSIQRISKEILQLDREQVLFSPGQDRMRSPKGFTLIETVVVVGVVGVLAGMAAPVVSAGLNRYEVITASQQIASTIRSARLQAVGRNRILRVRFDFPEDRQYQIVDADDNAVGLVQSLDDDITFADFTDLEFSTSGRLTSGVAASIVITNGDDAQDRTIIVSKSGQVELHSQGDEG
jgi:type IV fimbrial biogenesis protein FimT